MDEALTYTEDGSHVFVANEETGAVWECPVDYLEIAKARGWTPCGKPAPSYADLFDPAPGAAAQTGFDPAEHTVDEVNAHLAEHLESPGEIERVLQLEAAGKNRTTIHDPRPQVENDDTK